MSYKKYNDRLGEIKNLIRKRERELRLAVQDPKWNPWMETDQNKVSKTTSNSCKRTSPKSFRPNDDKP